MSTFFIQHHWKISAPYRWDISPYVKDGENQIEITAANTLANRMQDGLSRLMPIPPSGVLGPVRFAVLDTKSSQQLY